MTEQRTAISIAVPPGTELSIQLAKAIYRTTGRASVEVRRAAKSGEWVITAELFGTDHVLVVPKLEKAIDLLHEHGVPVRIVEHIDDATEEIDRETMRSILEGAEPA